MSNDEDPRALKLEWKRGLPLLLAAIIGVTVIVFVALDLDSGGSRRAPTTAQLGFTAPDLMLRSVDGAEVDLADLRGRPVIVHFWASWCSSCEGELPLLGAARRRAPAGDLQILTVVREDDARSGRRAVDEAGATWPLLVDADAEAWADYAVIDVPTSYFIDDALVLREVVLGPLDETALDEALTTIGIAPT